MKKNILVVIIILLFSLLSASMAFAQTDKVNFTGKIAEVNQANQTLTIETSTGGVYVVYFLEGTDFYFSAEDIGKVVHVKGVENEDGTILADWVKEVDPDEEENEELGESKENSAYCSGEKDNIHPVAIKIAEKLDYSVEEIMEHFCNGFGFGQIVLAIQTSKFLSGDVDTLLADREKGVGWGQIWKASGENGKPKGEHVPPGQEKKANRPGLDKEKIKDSK